MLPGFSHVPFNDLDALRGAMSERTAAVLLEPMQGVNGVTLATPEYLRGARALCDERRALLMLDEIQTGMGRTGKLWAYEHYGIEPDVMTVAKGLGGGIPVGACLARDEASVFEPGDHASTFGGNAVACAAGAAVLGHVLENDLVSHAARLGRRLAAGLQALAARPGSGIAEVRGLGLWYGIELAADNALLVWQRCLDQGLLVIPSANPRVLRIAPSLTVTTEECDEFLDRFGRALTGG
jgi:acetylornithine/succinyldiaminopimelate/putrescine aminotransferase